VLAPACWLILTGFVAGASDSPDAPNAGAALAAGLALIPFVFIVLAFTSEHPRAAGAVLKAMGLAILVGVLVSAAANDGITGLVAGTGAGGVVSLRMDADHELRLRVIALAMATVYTFVLVRVGGPIMLVPAPVFPFTAIGLADLFAERRASE
jgi:hypothetical protein